MTMQVMLLRKETMEKMTMLKKDMDMQVRKKIRSSSSYVLRFNVLLY